MANYTEFVAIYKTELLEPPFPKIVVDPVKVEVFVGPKAFRVPVLLGGALPAGRELPLTGEREIVLPADGRYLVATARTTAESADEAEAQAGDQLDRVLAALAVVYAPDLISQPIFRGFVASGSTRLLNGWVRLVTPFSLNNEEAVAAIGKTRQLSGTNADHHARFGLMSRFLVKASAYSPSEERFVLLWTVLEVFPLKGDPNIRPIAEFLQSLTGYPAAELKEKLGIGRLAGARGHLVHNGVLPIPKAELGRTVDRLEAICVAVIRGIAGLPYDGNLEKHFAKATGAAP